MWRQIREFFSCTMKNEPTLSRYVGEYPTAATIDKWDDGVSLFAPVGLAAAERLDRYGIGSMNDTERILACLFSFDGKVNNGGFGMWLYEPPEVLAMIPTCLEEVGANDMAQFVGEVLSPFGDLKRFEKYQQWEQYVDELPDEDHLDFEELSDRFSELEPAFLESVNAYIKLHWKEVRRD